jgi:hypothetical protein
MQGVSGRQSNAGRIFLKNNSRERKREMKDDEIVELRAKARFLSEIRGVGAKRRGDCFKTTGAVARHLIGLDLVEVIPAGQKPAGPGERKPGGPSEQKGGAGGKKSSGAPTAGRSIGSRSLSAPGAIIASSFSAAVPRLLPATGSSGSRRLGI